MSCEDVGALVPGPDEEGGGVGVEVPLADAMQITKCVWVESASAHEEAVPSPEYAQYAVAVGFLESVHGVVVHTRLLVTAVDGHDAPSLFLTFASLCVMRRPPFWAHSACA